MAYQASFLGQLDKYLRCLSSSARSGDHGLSWSPTHQWEQTFFTGVGFIHCKGIRRLPFVIRRKDIEPPASHTSQLLEMLYSAQTSGVPADECLLFDLFVREALEQCQRLFSLAPLSAGNDIGAAECGLLVKLMETLGHLLGLSFAFGEESNISLPEFYQSILVGAATVTDGQTSLTSAMVKSYPMCHIIKV